MCFWFSGDSYGEAGIELNIDSDILYTVGALFAVLSVVVMKSSCCFCWFVSSGLLVCF